MKKNLLFLLYGILSIALTLFFTACGPTPAYYGTYYSLDKNDYVTIDSTVYVKDSGTYNFTVNGDNIILENNSHLKLFNNYNVMCLADHVISPQNMEFDSRNTYFEATFSIPSESYLTFYKDGTISYIYLPDANAAWKGTYTINNGIISVYGNYVLSNKTIAKYYYLDSFLNLYFMVLCKDGAINQTTEEYKFTYNFSSSLNGYLVSGITGNFNNVIIPSTYKSVPVVGIEHSAFYKCTSLTGITILDCVTSIESYAFEDCSSLKNINVLENNANYKSIDGNLYSKDGKTLIQYAIGKTASSFTIPNNVTSIGAGAFHHCKSLTSVIIPDSVTVIEWYAFNNCINLTSVAIGNSVTDIGDNAFQDCNSLTSVIIPDSVTIIGRYAFNNCINLTSVAIGNSVTSIGDSEFIGCGQLTSITIPDSVTWIDYSAFKGCSSLTNINVLENNANYKSIDGNLYSKDGKTLIKYAIGKTATEFSIPNSVTSIGSCAFSGCSSITSINIPNSVTSIGAGAFSGCNSLGVEKNNGLLYVDKWLIGVNSISIDSATIKDKTVGIGDNAFKHCSLLTSVIIPDSVTSIGAGAFSGCTSLISINIPDSVVNISLSTIAGCSNLQYNEYDNAYYLGNDTNPYVILIAAKSADIIIINENTKTIASDAFDGCKSLKSITIPDSVTNIGYGLFGDVFHGCDSLKTVYMDSATLINTSFSDELPNFATDVYVRTDLTPTVSVYTNIYEKQDGTVIHDGKEYYHYKIKE